MELAKKEHKINLLQNEHRYLYSELITLLEKNGFDVGDELLNYIQNAGRVRNAEVVGDLGAKYHFSYYKLACETLRVNGDVRLKLLRAFKERINTMNDNAFIASRLIVNCKMLVCMKGVSSELIPLLDSLPSVKLGVDTELGLIEEVFKSLGIDYVATAKNGNEIVWLN